MLVVEEENLVRGEERLGIAAHRSRSSSSGCIFNNQRGFVSGKEEWQEGMNSITWAWTGMKIIELFILWGLRYGVYAFLSDLKDSRLPIHSHCSVLIGQS